MTIRRPMANFADLMRVIHEQGWWPFVKKVYAEVNEDNVFTNAAAMAYAWMFAIFPFVIFLLTLTPHLPLIVRGEALSKIYDILAEYVTPTVAWTIVENVRGVVDKPRGGLMSFGLLLTLYAASGGMNATMSSLDQAFDAGISRSYFVKRFIAMLLTMFMCLCLITIVLLLPVGTMLTNLLTHYSQRLPDIFSPVSRWTGELIRDLITGRTLTILTVARYVIGLTVMQILIGVIYHYGRSQRVRLRFFTPGSVLTAVGWIITGFAMRIYVERFSSYSATYGAVAGMVIMLMVFYVDAVILLLGAELDSEIPHYRPESTKPLIPSGGSASGRP